MLKRGMYLKKIFNICSRVLEQAISKHCLRLLKQNKLNVGICRWWFQGGSFSVAEFVFM